MSTYAIIDLITNLVLALVLWSGDTNDWSPPTGTYAIAVPSGVTVAIGDSYSTTTQTFTANYAPQPTATPVPPGTIGNCSGTECFGLNSYTGGNTLRFWSPEGGFVTLSLPSNFDEVNSPASNWQSIWFPQQQTGEVCVGPNGSSANNSYFTNSCRQYPVWAGRDTTDLNLSQSAPKGQVIYGGFSNGDLVLAAAHGSGIGNAAGDANDDIIFANGNCDSWFSNTQTCSNEKMRLKGSGRLGIGTASPTVALDVVGEAKFSTALGTASGGTGNANGTVSALTSDPADCASNRYATAINASGTLTCGQVSLSAGVTGTLPVSNGGNGAAPGADDQVLVSSSTSAGAWASVPNCTDASGNHLNYTASTNTFSCGTTSSTTSPTVEFDPSCDNTAVNSTSAVTVLTLPTFNNTGKTTIISGAIAMSFTSTSAGRIMTIDVKLGSTVKATFVSKSESATSKLTVPFHYVDNSCGSSCSFTVTVTSDATNGTQTATECYASRVSY